MSALIEGFKRDHSEIIEALKKVEELGILTKEGQAKLISVKSTLLEHLKEEDEKFYPVLLKAAEQNKKLKEELEIFAKDWDHISRVVFGFFHGYDKGVLDMDLLRSFDTLFMVLHDRIKNEEKFLYGEYEKINKQ
ncbi:MAG: hypothetical protein ACYST3_04120 [Planctomycetota bacterium]|jgi:hypothetical protein